MIMLMRAPRPSGLGQVDGVDDIKLGLLGDQVLLDRGRQLFPDLVLIEGGGQEEDAAFLKVADACRTCPGR